MSDKLFLEDADRSRHNMDTSLTVIDEYSLWTMNYADDTKKFQRAATHYRSFLGPQIDPEHIYTDDSKELKKGTKTLHPDALPETSTPHIPETHGKNEKVHVQKISESRNTETKTRAIYIFCWNFGFIFRPLFSRIAA